MEGLEEQGFQAEQSPNQNHKHIKHWYFKSRTIGWFVTLQRITDTNVILEGKYSIGERWSGVRSSKLLLVKINIFKELIIKITWQTIEINIVSLIIPKQAVCKWQYCLLTKKVILWSFELMISPKFILPRNRTIHLYSCHSVIVDEANFHALWLWTWSCYSFWSMRY